MRQARRRDDCISLKAVNDLSPSVKPKRKLLQNSKYRKAGMPRLSKSPESLQSSVKSNVFEEAFMVKR